MFFLTVFSSLPSSCLSFDFQPEIGACEQIDVIFRKKKVIFQGPILVDVKNSAI